MEIYGNNSTAAVSYTRFGTTQNLEPQTYDLWVDGVFVLNTAKGNLPADTDIDSFMFIGENSTNNDAIIYIDDIEYSNTLTLTTLPISLTSFTGKPRDQSILLNWETASEINNRYFEILKSVNGNTFTAIGTLKGCGTTNTKKTYSFVDENPAAGTNYYQLVQYDLDGKSTKSKIIAVKSPIASSSLTVYAAPGSVNISINAANETDGALQIFDITGKKINETKLNVRKGVNTLGLPLNLNSGIYIINFVTASKVISSKFMKE